MKNCIYILAALLLIFGCGTASPDIRTISLKVADIEVLRHTPSDVMIVMYGLHRNQCIELVGNKFHRKEGNTIHVTPVIGEFHSLGDCPETSEARVQLWLTGLSIGEYTLLGYTWDEYNRPDGYGTEWLVFRVEADRVVIVRKALKSNHEFQNRLTLDDL